MKLVGEHRSIGSLVVLGSIGYLGSTGYLDSIGCLKNLLLDKKISKISTENFCYSFDLLIVERFHGSSRTVSAHALVWDNL